jgi:PKD-like domain/Concanavalin A-like lectin/glucanases superfamily/FG-GAP-like repeat/IPT/TIG domain/Secretion system C-terminal sorting domain
MSKIYFPKNLFLLFALFCTGNLFSQTASNFVFSNLNTTSFTVSWTNGGGTGRIAVVRAFPNGITYPVNGTNYTANSTFGSGTSLGSSNFVVYKGTLSSVTVTGLTTNTLYYVTVFEYTGLSSNPTFYPSTTSYGGSSHYTLTSQPTTQATNVLGSAITNNSATVSWTTGNGTYALATVKAGATNTNLPSDGTVYFSSSSFLSGDPVGTFPYAYSVASTTGTSVNVTGLSPTTDYVAAAFEYNGTGGAQNYMTTSVSTDGFTTLANQPTSWVSNLSFTDIEDDAFTISWANSLSGGGNYHLVVINSVGSNDAPVDGTIYTANGSYGLGTQIGSSYVVYAGSNNAVRVTNLAMETNYTVRVYDFNGGTGTFNNTTNYQTYGVYAVKSSNVTRPSVAASNITFPTVNPTSVQANWTNGTGQARMVQVKAGRRQTALAFDGVDDYVTIPYTSALRPTSQVTLECWAYRSDWTTSGIEYLAGNAESGGYCLLLFNATMYYYTYRNGTWGFTTFNVTHLTPGWHHFAVTYDGSVITGYADGVPVGYNNAGATYPIGYTYSNSFMIGCDVGTGSASTGSYFNGMIDEVRVWNTAQSQFLINSNSFKSLYGNESGLLAEWKLDDGTVATGTAVNSSTSYYGLLSGTLTGFASTAASTAFTATSGWVNSHSPVNAPVDGSIYTPNSTFGAGAIVGTPFTTTFNYTSSSTSFVTGLSPGTWYTFHVYEYDYDSMLYFNYTPTLVAVNEIQTAAGTVPTITNMSPTSGPVGTVVTLTGTGFSAVTSSNYVYFGATKANVTNATATSLTVTVPYGANYNPVSVQVGGLYATYTREFIVTNSCAATITNTSFTASTLTSSGSMYTGGVKDMDLDGKTDILGGNYGSDLLNLWKGNASNGLTPATFTSAITTAAGDAPYFVETGDFDMDTKTDVAVTAIADNIVSVFRGLNGSFSTTPRFDFGTLQSPALVKSGDIDGDGRLDLVISYANGMFISVFRNTGSIYNVSFAPRQDINVGNVAPFALIVRDLDLDGKADIAFGSYNSNNIYALRSTSVSGSITFAALQTIATTAGTIVNGMAAGDFNQDGKADIAIALDNNTVALYSNTSTVGNIVINLGLTLNTLASNPFCISVNDLDGDGRPDLAVGYITSNTVSIFEASGNFGFSPRVDIVTSGTYSYNINSGDFNQDGKADLVVMSGTTTVNVLTNNLNALATEPTTASSGLSISGATQSSLTLNWTAGTGTDRIVVCREGLSANILPADGTSYIGNSVYGSGSNMGGGQYCVYNGNGNSVTLTGLQSNTFYYFAIFEFNGATCTTNYKTSAYITGVSATLNTQPTLNTISNPAVVCRNPGGQSVGLSGIGTGAGNETQTLAVTASSNNTALVSTVNVVYTSPNSTGTLTYTPVTNATGTATITVTVNDGASNNNTITRTFVVTVNAPPTTSAAGPNQTICTGTATLAANAPSVGVGLWSIDYTNDVTITVANLGNANTPNTTLNGLTAGDSVRLAWTISNAPCSPSVSYVTIKRGTCPLSAGFSWTPNALCANALQVNNVSFTDLSSAPNTSIVSWSWTFAGPITPSPSSSNVQNPSNIQFTGPGTFTVTLTVNDGSSNSTITQFITVNPYPAGSGTVSGPSTVCQGQSGVIYSVSTIANASTYNWVLPPGATIVNGSGTNLIVVDYSVSAASGPVQVQGVNSCGAGTASPVLNVTVNPLPGTTSSVIGSNTVCQGQNNVLYRTPVIPNATGYNWALPSGATIVGNANNDSIYVNFSASAINGLINVIGTNACGNGTSSIVFNLTVNPLPDAAGTISSNIGATVCQGASSVTYSITSLNNANSYTWTLPVGATIVAGAGTNSITVNYSISATSGNVTVSGVNGCGNGTTATMAITVSPLPAAATSITGTATVCQGQYGVNYFVTSIANASGYIWTLPPGAVISSGLNTNAITVDFTASAQSGVITVAGTNSCGTGAASAAFGVTVNPLPSDAGIIAGSATVCQGSTGIVFTVPTIANALNYNWQLPAGATIISGANTNSITVDFSTIALSGPVLVTGNNACGDGVTSDTLLLTVNPLPDPASAISGINLIPICPLTTGEVFTVPAIANSSYYVWSLPSGASIVAGDSTNSITVDFAVGASPGAIVVYGENACGVGTSTSLNFSFVEVTPSDICMVTVDSNSVYNHVIWNKPVAIDIDSFRIYREVTSNNYVHIGSVHYDSLSVYVDSVYIPFADPNTTFFRYKMSSVDTCGNESPLSAHHRTLFMQANVGLGGVVNLNWNPYEGALVDYFRIMRDSTGQGNWEAIDSVPGTTFVYTDVNPPTSVSVINIGYKLQTIWAISCSPSRNIVTSESNLKDVPAALITVPEHVLAQQIGIYPNPSDGNFTLVYPYSVQGYDLVVHNALGQIVYEAHVSAGSMHAGENVLYLPLNTLARGTYYLTMTNGETEAAHKKLIIQ